MSERVDLRSMTLNELKDFAISIGVPAFRGAQIFDWIYKGKKSFREMNNLPEALRYELEDKAYLEKLNIRTVQKSKLDGTRKYLLELSDGNTIECVFMKYKFGNSICVSSQAGCRMGCRFCASTIKGLARNLTAGEMISQIMAAQEDSGEKIGHIVVMGSGEPFDNYENLSKFLRIVNEPKGLGIGMRNITVSTCGIVPMILRFAEDFNQVNLAISLHASSDEDRSAIMPINNRYDIKEVLSACDEYTKKTKRRITYEYTLVSGVNDSVQSAKRLAGLLKGKLCHVNLIPLNEVKDSGFVTVSKSKAFEFQKALEEAGIPATIRRELGDDIDAACGQLRLNNE